MVIYENTAENFRNDVDRNSIVGAIETRYQTILGRRVGDGERASWNNSLRFMETIIRRSEIPGDCGVLIEYMVPPSSKRIDFVLAGHDDEGKSNFVIIELKQWERAMATDKEDLVNTYVAGALRDVAHPSYQAWTYKQFMLDMNESVEKDGITLESCAYLHNYERHDPEPLLYQQYQDIVSASPLFFRDDAEKLEAFVKKYVGKGRGREILFAIENGEIRPSKKLIDCVTGVFKGQNEFILMDEQKVAYSTIIDRAKNAKAKTTILVNGGPGTGKSVVAVNAFVALLALNLNVRFVAPNAAFRSTMIEKLCEDDKKSKTRVKELFSGSSCFVDSATNDFDVIVCDEAHRLKKHGAYQYRGESQVKDIIKASRVNVFFVDDSQKIRLEDEGSVARIKEVAKSLNSQVISVHLDAQFRCAGAEGFLNWIDDVLQMRSTATGNFDGWDREAFDFRLVDDPNELHRLIEEKNNQGLSARLLAGYAWPWTGAKDGNPDAEIADVCIPDKNFALPWNSRSARETWAIKPEGINQVGCVHTAQGLEFDYVGVIIGKDLQFDPDTLTVHASLADYKDISGKKGLKERPEDLTKYIKNIYKILLSRGMKGCYVYCCDENLKEHFNNLLH